MSFKTAPGIDLTRSLIIIFIRTLVLLFFFFFLTSVQGFSQGKPITIDGRESAIKPNGKQEYAKKQKAGAAVKNADCQYSKNHIDSLQGTTIKILGRETLVSHTPQELKKIFTDHDYISIEAYLSNYNHHFALFFKVSLGSNNSHAAYGPIFKDNKLILKLKNGQSITLHSGQSESGSVDRVTDKTTYKTFYELNEAAMDILQSADAEMMRLYWSKGYEDYPISNPDFFRRQIQCVK